MTERCEHWSPGPRLTRGGRCALGKFGGTPSYLTCAQACPVATAAAQQWARAQVKPSDPVPLRHAARDFARVMASFVRDGMRTVTEEQYNQRRAICEACPEWNDAARMGAGRCRLCRCTRLKWEIPQSKCPLDKWPPV